MTITTTAVVAGMAATAVEHPAKATSTAIARRVLAKIPNSVTPLARGLNIVDHPVTGVMGVVMTITTTATVTGTVSGSRLLTWWLIAHIFKNCLLQTYSTMPI